MNIFENEKDRQELEMLLKMDAQMQEKNSVSAEELEQMVDQFTIEEMVSLTLCWGDDLPGTAINLIMQADMAGTEKRHYFIELTGKLMLKVKEGFEVLFFMAMQKRIEKNDRTILILIDIAKNGNLCPMAGPVEGGIDWRF